MRNLAEVRKRFIAALIVLAVIAGLAAAYVWLPITANSAQLAEEAQQARQEMKLKQAQSVPLQGLEGKLAAAEQQIREFKEERLPERFSAISEQLGELANSARVSFSNVRYETEPTAIRDLTKVEINAAVAGDYRRVVRFINQVERSQMFMIISQVALAGQQGGNVILQIKMETYLDAGQDGTGAATAATGD